MLIAIAAHAGDVILLGLLIKTGAQREVKRAREKRDGAYLRGWSTRDCCEAKDYNRYRAQLLRDVRPVARVRTSLLLRARHTFLYQVQHALA